MSAANWAVEQRFDTLRVGVADSALTVTIDQPATLNALSPAVVAELRTVFGELRSRLGAPDEAGANPDWSIRGVVLTGAEGRAFVAGADISALSAMDAEAVRGYAAEVHELLEWIETLQVPVIAAVNGYALGGGCELAMACDMIYAVESASFGQPEVGLGIIPGFGGCVRLQRYVGPAFAREMIFTGRRIDATEAQRIGLVSRVLPDSGALLVAARATVAQIAQQSPAAVAAAKRTVDAVRALPTDRGAAVELDAFAARFGSPDMREGVEAFLQKRPASFRGE